MPQRINQRAFLLFVLATGALLILASGISQIALRPGISRPVASAAKLPLALPVQLRLAGNELIFYLFLACLILAIIALALVPEGRVRLVRFIIWVAMLYLLSQLIAPAALVKKDQVAETEVAGLAGEAEISPTATPQPGIVSDFEPPDWLVTAAGVGLALLLVGGAAGIVWFIFWRSRPSALEQVSLEAQGAVEALQAGGDYQDIVLNCYARMGQVLLEQRGVSRESSMTPHEFERALSRLGFPSEPLQTLTHVFEEVRYGGIEPGENGRQMAVSSLNAIISYCKSLEPV